MSTRKQLFQHFLPAAMYLNKANTVEFIWLKKNSYPVKNIPRSNKYTLLRFDTFKQKDLTVLKLKAKTKQENNGKPENNSCNSAGKIGSDLIKWNG